MTPRLSRLSGGSGRARLFHSGPPRPLRPPLEETRKKTNQQIREETNAERRAYLESASRTCLSLLLHQDTSVVTGTPLLLLTVSKEDWTPFEREGQRTCVQLPATISEERASHRAPSEIVCLSSSERVFIVKHKEDILRRKRYHGEQGAPVVLRSTTTVGGRSAFPNVTRTHSQQQRDDTAHGKPLWLYIRVVCL